MPPLRAPNSPAWAALIAAALFLGVGIAASTAWTPRGAEPPTLDTRRPGPAEGPSADLGPTSPSPAGAQLSIATGPPPLQDEIVRLLQSVGTRTSHFAVMAFSLDRGDTLVAFNASEPMIPASNMKVLTTAAALYYLEPSFRYETFLVADGRQKGRTLEGDLILYGTGDPTLSDQGGGGTRPPLDSLASLVAASGIREITGDLVIDGSFFQGPDLHPDWDPKDFNDAFAAPVAAVGYNENVLTIRVEPAPRMGDPPLIHAVPAGTGIPVLNLAVTSPPGSRSRIWLLRDDPRDPIGIEGQIPLGGRDVWRRLPVPDPLRYTGRLLRQALSRAGVELKGDITTLRDPARSPVARATQEPASPHRLRTVARWTSAPLLEILTVTNKESNNFYAESVGKSVGRAVLAQGTFAAGAEAVSAFLQREVGVAPEDLQIRDGSGLSPQNRVTARALVQTLRYLALSPLWDPFWSTLPEAGVRRELSRMYRSPAARNLRAKTGTMNGVSALSGMVRTRTGERILFSILSNHVPSEYRAKRAEDRIGILLASLDRPPDPRAGPPEGEDPHAGTPGAAPGAEAGTRRSGNAGQG